jgi:spermidine synthase
VRYLHFGSSWVQGAMRIARPYALELDYTREMLTPLLLHPDHWPKRVLLVGLGAGSLVKFLWRNRPDAKLTVVEIEPRMVAVAQQFFKLPDDPERIDIQIADGADFMIASKRRYDLILVDGFDAEARTGRLDTVAFYLNCRARLADEGILSINLLSRRKDFTHSVARLEEAFDGRAIAFPSCDSGNAIALAVSPDTVCSQRPAGSTLGVSTFEDLASSAQSLRKATGLNLLPTLARLTGTRHAAGGVLRL